MILPRKRILVAEDDASLVKMLRFRLEHEGFVVFVARDGEEAIREVRVDGPIDLLLLDVKMPGLDGYTVCRRLRSEPATARVPILIMSGTAIQVREMADRCIEVGANGWIQKPFVAKDLMEKIQGLLSEEGKRDE